MACQGYQWSKWKTTSTIQITFIQAVLTKRYLGSYRHFLSHYSWRHMGSAGNTSAQPHYPPVSPSWNLFSHSFLKVLYLFYSPHPPKRAPQPELRWWAEQPGWCLSQCIQPGQQCQPEGAQKIQLGQGSRGRLMWVVMPECLVACTHVLLAFSSSFWRPRRGRTTNYSSFPCAVTALGKAGSELLFSFLLLFLQLSDLSSGISNEVHSKFSVSKLFLCLKPGGISRWNII